MEQIWQWGLGVIHFVQQIRSPFFDLFFKAVSFFGATAFYVIFLPLLYWCFDKKFARRLIVIFFISGWVNSVMKNLISHPRPYNLDLSVKIGSTGGPGLPSGHAQQSLVVWGFLAKWAGKRLFTYFSAVFIVLIALSRIYLGVHFPTDIFGGWALALIILLFAIFYTERIERLFSSMNRYLLAVSLIVIPGLLSQVYAGSQSEMAMGALSGFGLGVMFEIKYIDFTAAVNFRNSIIRYFLGLFIMMLLYSAGSVLPDRGSLPGMIALYIHSWILGFVIAAGIPLIFRKLGI